MNGLRRSQVIPFVMKRVEDEGHKKGKFLYFFFIQITFRIWEWNKGEKLRVE